MPLIKPRTRGKQVVRRIVRLDRETNETLFAYAHFLGESTDYVLNEVIDTVLARDKEFVTWRTEHSESFVPPSPAMQPTAEAPTEAPRRRLGVSSRRARCTVGRARLNRPWKGESHVSRASCATSTGRHADRHGVLAWSVSTPIPSTDPTCTCS